MVRQSCCKNRQIPGHSKLCAVASDVGAFWTFRYSSSSSCQHCTRKDDSHAKFESEGSLRFGRTLNETVVKRNPSRRLMYPGFLSSSS